MKRKGFTLIELLAVIVILAVISLIAVPVMLNVIERVRKGAFEDTAYGIIDAAKQYYVDSSVIMGYICDHREIEIPTKINGVTIRKTA